MDEHGNWNIRKVQDTFLPIDAEEILKIKPSRRGGEDVLAWMPERSGIFSVSSAYKLAFNELPVQCSYGSTSHRPTGEDSCWKRIWNSSVPPKVKNFAWRAASNDLATEEKKLSRQMKVTGLCRICNREKEDVTHALYRCPHENYLWKAMRECWQLPTGSDMQVPSRSWFHTLVMLI